MWMHTQAQIPTAPKTDHTSSELGRKTKGMPPCQKQAHKTSLRIFSKINLPLLKGKKKIKSLASWLSLSRRETLISITHVEKLLHGRDFQLHHAEPELRHVTWLPASMDELCNTPLSCGSCEKWEENSAVPRNGTHFGDLPSYTKEHNFHIIPGRTVWDEEMCKL